jgi:hypothetical protein
MLHSAHSTSFNPDTAAPAGTVSTQQPATGLAALAGIKKRSTLPPCSMLNPEAIPQQGQQQPVPSRALMADSPVVTANLDLRHYAAAVQQCSKPSQQLQAAKRTLVLRRNQRSEELLQAAAAQFAVLGLFKGRPADVQEGLCGEMHWLTCPAGGPRGVVLLLDGRVVGDALVTIPGLRPAMLCREECLPCPVLAVMLHPPEPNRASAHTTHPCT